MSRGACCPFAFGMTIFIQILIVSPLCRLGIGQAGHGADGLVFVGFQRLLSELFFLDEEIPMYMHWSTTGRNTTTISCSDRPSARLGCYVRSNEARG